MTGNPIDENHLFNEGLQFYQAGHFKQAQQTFQSILQEHPNHLQALHLLGVTHVQLGNLQQGLQCLQKVVSLNPQNAEAHNNLAFALYTARQYSLAIEAYRKAIALQPNFVLAHYHLGSIIAFASDHETAITHFKRVIQLQPDFAEAYLALARSQVQLKRYQEAINNFKRTLSLGPQNMAAFNAYVSLLNEICQWDEVEKIKPTIKKRVDQKQLIAPFLMLSLLDSPEYQLKVARNYYESVIKKPQIQAFKNYNIKKTGPLRIAYLSSDFFAHATSFLIAELFELHDRSKFEIYGYSFGRMTEDAVQQRVVKAFDYFENVQQMTDETIAKKIHEAGISIVIDLKGYTNESRSTIFRYRAAPVQITYLGFPGTLGSDDIDYAIVDDYIVPEKSQQYFSEKLIYMPDSYQVNDRKRVVAKIPSRSSCELPDDVFVFGCFNITYKINPEIFDVWMRLLQKVPNSVLWILENNDWATENLQKAAEKRGVSTSRLVFAPRSDNPDYLAKYVHMDLFLDTLPVNAHTTASDALWMGTPVLTCSGDSFAARVAGSLLRAAGLPEMITNSLEEYEQLAYRLATHPGKLKKIKKQLQKQRDKTALFDTPGFCKHLESAYQKIWQRYLDGGQPETFYVKD